MQVCNDLGTVSKFYAAATALADNSQQQGLKSQDGQGNSVPLITAPSTPSEDNKGINIDITA